MLKMGKDITKNMYLRADLSALGLLVQLAGVAENKDGKLYSKIVVSALAMHTHYTIGQLRGTLARLEQWGMIRVVKKGKKKEAFLIEILRYFSAE